MALVQAMIKSCVKPDYKSRDGETITVLELFNILQAGRGLSEFEDDYQEMVNRRIEKRIQGETKVVSRIYDEKIAKTKEERDKHPELYKDIPPY